MSTTKIRLPITTRFLVETYAEKHGMLPAEAAYFLASMGRTTQSKKRRAALRSAPLFSDREVVRPASL